MKQVADMGLIQSLPRHINCWNSACIKNFFRHLKSEIPHFSAPETLEEVTAATSEYINYYNDKRLQLKYGMSPSEFRLHTV